ncbi:transglutaminase family protein [Siculibacillus lacustris]|uniref:Transglutaminase family protein n=1 Tax=Siculibacillus lacustris TaxID=1549641 RepID=A0A4Q9VT25_9HYPH|nr:transglutaminase N-terminal domain-containing protein [Siculibacillus lacustris]TBW38231.1 transglutaminase family protein [Siculibacillus lacustris]
MRFAIIHETVYRFEHPATRAIQTLRLTPRNTDAQLVQSWRIDVSQDCRLVPVEDAFGNLTHTFSIDGPIDELSIVASGRVATLDTSGVLRHTRDRLPLSAYGRCTDRTAIETPVRDFAFDTAVSAGPDRIAELHALMGALHERIAIDPEAPERRPAETLAAGSATARDLAHLFAAAARALDIATRVVVGYVYRGDETVAGAPHLWIEAHLGPGLGWVGFDAVENSCPTDAWVRLAVGLDALDATPIRGVRSHRGAETCETRITLREIAAV